jgi:sRNA-binding regulator protein Hfq
VNQRKLIRPDVGDARKTEGPRGVRRKASPPEQTNAEEFYYLKQMQARTPMVLRLVNGEELRGWVEWYDKGAIKFHRHEEPNLLIPKSSILYLFKEEELRRRPKKTTGTGVPGQAGPRPGGRDDDETTDTGASPLVADSDD